MASLGDIEELTALSRSQLQFWIGANVLKPTGATDRKGRGVHRDFDVDETIVAVIMGVISKSNWPIGRLISISGAIRDDLLKEEEFRQAVNEAIAGRANLFVILDWSFKLTFLKDPTPSEVYAHTVASLAAKEYGDNYTKSIVYLTPGLTKARAALP